MSEVNACCQICRQKNNTYRYQKLIQLHNISRSIAGESATDKVGQTLIFNWGLNSRCKFGVSCHQLRVYDMRCQQMAKQSEVYLTYIAREGSDKDFHMILEMLRGDFPAVYNVMEYERNQRNKRRR